MVIDEYCQLQDAKRKVQHFLIFGSEIYCFNLLMFMMSVASATGLATLIDEYCQL